MKNIFKVISKAGFTVTLMLSLKGYSNYTISGQCDVYAYNDRTNKYDRYNGKGFLTAINDSAKFRGETLNHQLFIHTAHQDYDQKHYNETFELKKLDNIAKCGDIELKLSHSDSASKEIKLSREKSSVPSKPKECEIDTTTRSFNHNSSNFIWSACDLSVNKIEIKNHDKAEGIYKIQPYSVEYQLEKINSLKSVIMQINFKNQIKLISCPIKEHFAGGMVANCPRIIKFKLDKENEVVIEIKNIDDIYNMEISSGSAVFATEIKNGKTTLKKIKNFPAAIGLVKDFMLGKEDFDVVIENLQLSKDIAIPENLALNNFSHQQ